MNIASDNFCLKYLVHIYETSGWLACWSSVSYIIGPPYLAQARRALTWLGQRLNNKTDSKRSSPIYFASSHLRIKLSNSWWLLCACSDNHYYDPNVTEDAFSHRLQLFDLSPLFAFLIGTFASVYLSAPLKKYLWLTNALKHLKWKCLVNVFAFVAFSKTWRSFVVACHSQKPPFEREQKTGEMLLLLLLTCVHTKYCIANATHRTLHTKYCTNLHTEYCKTLVSTQNTT